MKINTLKIPYIFNLNRESVAIIPNGLQDKFLRIEVCEKHENSMWIAELELVGQFPVYPEQSVEVIVRIMSNKFLDHVAMQQPVLQVMRGGYKIGELQPKASQASEK